MQILFFFAFSLGYQLLKGTVLCIYAKICCIYTKCVELNLKLCCISFSFRQLSQQFFLRRQRKMYQYKWKCRLSLFKRFLWKWNHMHW